jgi:hypothetical protein
MPSAGCEVFTVHIEEFSTAGRLTAESAEDLAAVASRPAQFG